MRKVYTAANSLLVNHYRNILMSAGIECEIRQVFLSGGAGELPPTECWPELWIKDDAREDDALALIHDSGQVVTGPHWHCPCGEILEPQFSVCWRCGRSRE